MKGKIMPFWRLICLLFLIAFQGNFFTASAATATVTNPTDSKGPGSVENCILYTDSYGVKWYFVKSPLECATVYAGEGKTVNQKMTGNTTINNIPIAAFKDGAAPTGSKTYSAELGNNTYTYTLETDDGLSLYYVENWKENNEFNTTSAGRTAMVIPESVTIDGTVKYVNELSTRKGSDNVDYQFGQDEPNAPMDILLPKYFKEFDNNCLYGCNNIYEISFSDATSLWAIHDYAFSGSSNISFNLTDASGNAITFSHLYNLGAYAFYGTSIKRLYFTHPLVNISGHAFDSDNLEYIDLSKFVLNDDQKASVILSRDASAIKTYINSDNNGVNIAGIANMFAAVPAHVLIYVNQDMISKAKTLSGGEGPNFIKLNTDLTSGTCENFAVYDNADNTTRSYDYFVPTPFTATKATYDRSLPTGWMTLYIPFPCALPSSSSDFKVYEAASTLEDTKKQDNGMTHFVFTQVSPTTLSANTPYLIYNGTGSKLTIAEADNVSVPKSKDVKDKYNSLSNGSSLFWGTTEDVDNATAAEWGAYNLYTKVQKWAKISTSNTKGYIGHFRCFIISGKGSSSAKPATVDMELHDLDGTVTKIATVHPNALFNGNDNRIYDLSGNYRGTDITTLPAGVYVKNQQKFIIK